MNEELVRGFDRGTRRGLIGMGLVVAAASPMPMVGALVAPGTSVGERVGAFGLGFLCLVLGLGAARLAQRRNWVEVDRPKGTVTISNFGITTRVELCEECRLDTESIGARWNAPKLRCTGRTWNLSPLKRSPPFLGGPGDGPRAVCGAIRLALPSSSETT